MPVPVPYSFVSEVPITTYTISDADGAMATCACTIFAGNFLDIFFHVFPPSVDLKIPPLVPDHSPFSQGPSRDCHKVAKIISVLLGSMATSSPPVFSSMYKTLVNVFPPSSDL